MRVANLLPNLGQGLAGNVPVVAPRGDLKEETALAADPVSGFTLASTPTGYGASAASGKRLQWMDDGCSQSASLPPRMRCAKPAVG